MSITISNASDKKCLPNSFSIYINRYKNCKEKKSTKLIPLANCRVLPNKKNKTKKKFIIND